MLISFLSRFLLHFLPSFPVCCYSCSTFPFLLFFFSAVPPPSRVCHPRFSFPSLFLIRSSSIPFPPLSPPTTLTSRSFLLPYDPHFSVPPSIPVLFHLLPSLFSDILSFFFFHSLFSFCHLPHIALRFCVRFPFSVPFPIPIYLVPFTVFIELFFVFPFTSLFLSLPSSIHYDLPLLFSFSPVSPALSPRMELTFSTPLSYSHAKLQLTSLE